MIEQLERYNRTFFQRPRLYVAANQRIWDAFVKLLTYDYSYQPNPSTNVSQFFLTLTQYRPGPVTIDGLTVFPADFLTATTPKALRICISAQLTTIFSEVFEHLLQIQRRCKNYFDR